MSNKRRPPVYVACVNSVRIRVHRNGGGRYCIAWRHVAGGQRMRETFGTRLAGTQRADEIALAIANGRSDVLELTSADRDSYRAAIALLAPLSTPLLAAVDEYTRARDIIAPAGLMEAAAFWQRGNASRHQCPPTARITAELLSSLQNRQHRPITHKTAGPLKLRLAAIAKAIPELAQAGTHELLTFLENLRHKGQPIAAKTRDHFRDALRQLYSYAQMRAWIPSGPHPATPIARIWQPHGVSTYTVAELRAMLAACPEKWIPHIALGAFAGLRPSEVWRLRWEHFRWEEDYIAISAVVAAKTFRGRPVPILPALAAWLSPYRREFGPLYPYQTLDLFEDAIGRMISTLRNTIVGFAWKQDGLRHSYVSHRIGDTENPEKVRREAGHTASMQERHYDDPKRPAESAAWFAVLPPWLAADIVPVDFATNLPRGAK